MIHISQIIESRRRDFIRKRGFRAYVRGQFSYRPWWSFYMFFAGFCLACMLATIVPLVFGLISFGAILLSLYADYKKETK